MIRGCRCRVAAFRERRRGRQPSTGHGAPADRHPDRSSELDGASASYEAASVVGAEFAGGSRRSRALELPADETIPFARRSRTSADCFGTWARRPGRSSISVAATPSVTRCFSTQPWLEARRNRARSPTGRSHNASSRSCGTRSRGGRRVWAVHFESVSYLPKAAHYTSSRASVPPACGLTIEAAEHLERAYALA